ncbi:MAG TPA: methyltransferase domain-containing protein [Candidatus Paceibacterota bacterium]|nr:methyltransferase domain-containing protein [Candidatus Paceibacterota bacterium]
MLTRARNTYRDLFAYPRERILSDEQEGEYWKARRPDGLSKLRPWQMSRARIVESALESSAGPFSIGDIGSGGGAMLRYLKSRLPVSEATAYDNDSASLADAEGDGIRAKRIDLRDANAYADIESADYFLLFEILEHLPRPEILLESLKEKARRGIFFSVPNTGYLKHRFRLFFGKVPAQWIVHPGEHLRFWTIRDMRWWLGAQGFSNYRIIPYRGIPILNKIWPNLFAAGQLVYVPKNEK